MSKATASQEFNANLHVSHNQILTYLNCSLKYQFQYVERRPPEKISIALPFGSAIHRAVEMFYTSYKNKGAFETLEAICQRFQNFLELDLENPDMPIVFKKDLPDQQGAIELGKNMLAAFYKSACKTIDDQEIVAVEQPLTATLYTEEGQPTDYKLVGIIDLILRNNAGEIIVVDNKTAAKPMAQNTADDDNQVTAYSYLLAANKIKHLFQKLTESLSVH
jgi:putative RecB family exonuclease